MLNLSRCPRGKKQNSSSLSSKKASSKPVKKVKTTKSKSISTVKLSRSRSNKKALKLHIPSFRCDSSELKKLEDKFLGEDDLDFISDEDKKQEKSVEARTKKPTIPTIELENEGDGTQFSQHIETLFRESDKENVTVRSFYRALEEKIDRKLTKECKRTVRNRLKNLFNEGEETSFSIAD